MKIEQFICKNEQEWAQILAKSTLRDSAQLALIFSGTEKLKNRHCIDNLSKVYPQAIMFGCSTAGEICGTNVFDDTSVITAICFEKTIIKASYISITNNQDSFTIGQSLVNGLDKNGLSHVFVLSDGLSINGSELTSGLTSNLPPNVVVTGGLAGDGSRFQETYVFKNNIPEKNTIAILGFYGKDLKIGCGSFGGWDPFGPERLITKSKGNILYELDGESALSLYKKYLGEYANGLPSTGLLFPLSIRFQDRQDSLVRTILSVNEEKQSLTFAGDVPVGHYARLMKANFDRLIDGAINAAKTTYKTIGSFSPELAILISCVGRKLILKQRVEEEVEGVREALGGKTIITGFYSYGEIAPFAPGARCELHNQTMTITAFSER